MKKLVSLVAVAAFMFSINAFAGVTQEQEKKKKKLKQRNLVLQKRKKHVELRNQEDVVLLKKLKLKKLNFF